MTDITGLRATLDQLAAAVRDKDSNAAELILRVLNEAQPGLGDRIAQAVIDNSHARRGRDTK
jgi:hypothetical protein